MACDLPDSHVQVTKLDWAARDTPATLHSLEEAVAEQCAAARLARWQETVQDDVPRLAAWIRADPPASLPGALQTDVALARCLDLGQLIWRHVRVVLVPKEDGSRRPIAIAAIAYRIAMTAAMKALRP